MFAASTAPWFSTVMVKVTESPGATVARFVPSSSCLINARSKVSASACPPASRKASAASTRVTSPAISMLPSLLNSPWAGFVIANSKVARTLVSTMSGVTSKLTVELVGVHVSVTSAGGTVLRVSPEGNSRIETLVIAQSSSIPGPGVSMIVTVAPRSSAVSKRVSMPDMTWLPFAFGSSRRRTNLRASGLGTNSWRTSSWVKVPAAVTKVMSCAAPSCTASWLRPVVMKAVPEILFCPLTASVNVNVMTPLLTVATAMTCPAGSARSKVKLSGASSASGRPRLKKSPPEEPLGTVQSTSKVTSEKMVASVVVTRTSVTALLISAALAGAANPTIVMAITVSTASHLGAYFARCVVCMVIPLLSIAGRDCLSADRCCGSLTYRRYVRANWPITGQTTYLEANRNEAYR